MKTVAMSRSVFIKMFAGNRFYILAVLVLFVELVCLAVLL